MNPDHISPQELQLIMQQCPRISSSQINGLYEAFRVFDREQNGLIAENEVRTIFTQLGETVTLEEINSLLCQLNVDETGRISYDEFIQLIMS